jgi:hypothetical protein
VYEVMRYLGYRKVAAQGEHIDRPAPYPPAGQPPAGPSPQE